MVLKMRVGKPVKPGPMVFGNSKERIGFVAELIDIFPLHGHNDGRRKR